MRLLAVASVISVLVAAATFACSSSDPVTPAADAGKDAKAQQTTDDDDTNADPDSGDGVTDPPVTTDEAGTDAGEAGTVNPGTTDAGHRCTTGSTPEVEPNDTTATATPLPSANKKFSLCGQVVNGDVDVFTFDTPDYNSNFGATRSPDKVEYTIDIGSKHFDGFPNQGFGNDINPGDKWVITVKTNSPDARSYSVDFEFN